MTGAPLWRHPAGPFFALAGLAAVALPWLWLLPLDDPAMAHVRLGIFGVGGGAITGYVLTAARAWTPRRPPVPLMVLVVLWLLGRIAALVWPWGAAAALPQAVLGLAVLWPILSARAWRRLPLAGVPLLLAPAEAALVAGWLAPHALATAMAFLLLLVGGRAIPAFLATEAARSGNAPRWVGPLWPAGALFILSGVTSGVGQVLALIALAALIFWRALPALRAGAANRMLAAGWVLLAPALPFLMLSQDGPASVAAMHLMLMGAMGGTILAFAARASMLRVPGGSLGPRPAHLAALALVLVAVPLRIAAALTPDLGSGWLVASGLCWSFGWVLFLACHLAALPRPAPFPVLSAARRA